MLQQLKLIVQFVSLQPELLLALHLVGLKLFEFLFKFALCIISYMHRLRMIASLSGAFGLLFLNHVSDLLTLLFKHADLLMLELQLP